MGNTKWRLIDDCIRTGAMNMALDLVLQQGILRGGGAPTLHVYRWAPEAVSLGRMQKAEAALNLEACAWDGVDVVRRPTGGRAVLHGRDYTFSIVARADGLISRNVCESYALLARVTRRALGELGLRADIGRVAARGAARSACFSSATLADVIVEGRKIAGGAQRWEGIALLQQNSLLRSADHERTLRYIRPGRRQSRDSALWELADSTVTLEEALGSSPAHDQITAALSGALAHELATDVERDEFSEEEVAMANERVAIVAA